MSQKKSKVYYAEKLGVSTEDIDKLLEEIRKGVTAVENEPEVMNYVKQLEETILKFDENVKDNQAEVTAKVKEQIKSLDELIEKCQIDTKTWNIDRFVQNFWGSITDPHWQVKAWLSKKTNGDNFQKNFIEFLKTYNPKVIQIKEVQYNKSLPKGCLVINKQDQHLNKYDIHGENSLNLRFREIYNKTKRVLEQAIQASNLEKIYYIIGSDQFNAEWTGTTTRGTKQENLDTYHQTFEAICNHEINMINLLLSKSGEIEILFVSGNHDEYVGWHLITWLKAYYKGAHDIKFDTSPRYRKYIRYGKNALMFNHGDAIKPPKLANMFPIEFKDEWSNCENYYIFTGDKHHEITMDFHGIMFYQLPALSKSKSFWDDKQGHTCSKAELVAFLIDSEDGVTGILKQRV